MIRWGTQSNHEFSNRRSKQPPSSVKHVYAHSKPRVSSLLFNTKNMGWSTTYIEGSKVITSKYILSLKIGLSKQTVQTLIAYHLTFNLGFVSFKGYPIMKLRTGLIFHTHTSARTHTHTHTDTHTHTQEYSQISQITICL